MKKTRKPYECPMMQSFTMRVVLLGSVSGGYSEPGNNASIGYGGIDTDGTMTPGSRSDYNLWGDDYEEE